MLALDDTPTCDRRSYGNLVRIKPFHGDLEDRGLLRVRPFLERTFAAPSVRRIEKRGW